MEQQNEEHYTQIAELQAFILQQIQLTHMVANDLWDQLQQQRLQLASQQDINDDKDWWTHEVLQTSWGTSYVRVNVCTCCTVVLVRHHNDNKVEKKLQAEI